MKNYSEKRHYERYDYKAPASLYRYEYQDQDYNANIYNCSKKGMYLRTDKKMHIGQHVYIKDDNKDSEKPEKNKSYSGYIKWSNEPGTSDPDGQYGYGIEYMESVYT